MAQRVLEIGSGGHPATQNPGTLFTNEHAEYVAVDANDICAPYSIESYGLRRTITQLPIAGVKGAMNALPFKAEAFDHVIMKSVIGQYSLHLLDTEFRGDPDAPNISTGISFTDTMAGFNEIFRILKPGGKLAVAEEDTPADHKKLTQYFRGVGFTAIQMTPFRADQFTGRLQHRWEMSRSFHEDEVQPDDAWVAARSTYWSTDDTFDRYGKPIDYAIDTARDYYATSYVLTAERPATTL